MACQSRPINTVRHTQPRHINSNKSKKMKAHMKPLTLAIALCCAVLCSAPATAVDQPAPSEAQRAHDEAQQLLKDRDEARPKAKAAEQKLREGGLSADSLGFENARAIRDQQSASGSKATAYDRYAKTAKRLEKKIQDEVERGVRPIVCLDIARYERLQAEVDLARIAGRLPAREE